MRGKSSGGRSVRGQGRGGSFGWCSSNEVRHLQMAGRGYERRHHLEVVYGWHCVGWCWCHEVRCMV